MNKYKYNREVEGSPSCGGQSKVCCVVALGNQVRADSGICYSVSSVQWPAIW